MRNFLYNTLSNDLDLRAIHGGRVMQGESLMKVPAVKPFLIYRIGNETDENFSFDVKPNRQFFQVYIHDEPADYSRIDRAVKLTKQAFERVGNSPSDNILEIRYLETSRDLDDPTMSTILRYVRFQAIRSR